MLPGGADKESTRPASRLPPQAIVPTSLSRTSEQDTARQYSSHHCLQVSGTIIQTNSLSIIPLSEGPLKGFIPHYVKIVNKVLESEEKPRYRYLQKYHQ